MHIAQCGPQTPQTKAASCRSSVSGFQAFSTRCVIPTLSVRVVLAQFTVKLSSIVIFIIRFKIAPSDAGMECED